MANAKLRLFASVAGADTLPYAVDLHATADTAWTEAALTWNNKPAMGTRLTGATIQGSTNQWYEWDVTSYVQQELSSGDGVLSLGLKNPANTATYVRFASGEAATSQAELVLTPPSQSVVTTANTLAVEEGGSGTYGVRLAAAPASDVTVAVAKQAGGDADLTTATGSLTFTPANWNVNQTVTVTAAQSSPASFIHNGSVAKEMSLEQIIGAVARSKAKRGYPMQPGCSAIDISRLRQTVRESLHTEPPDGYAELLRITNGIDENGLTVYASVQSRQVVSNVLGGEYILPGFVEENEALRLDRAGYDGLLVFAVSAQYAHVQDLQSGKFALLPHENDPAEPSEVFDTFDQLMIDAITRVAKPR